MCEIVYWVVGEWGFFHFCSVHVLSIWYFRHDLMYLIRALASHSELITSPQHMIIVNMTKSTHSLHISSRLYDSATDYISTTNQRFFFLPSIQIRSKQSFSHQTLIYGYEHETNTRIIYQLQFDRTASPRYGVNWILYKLFTFDSNRVNVCDVLSIRRWIWTASGRMLFQFHRKLK